MCKGVKVRYSTGAKYAREYHTKTIRFENGIPPLTSLSGTKDPRYCVFIDFGAIEKLCIAQLPENARFLSYTLLEK